MHIENSLLKYTPNASSTGMFQAVMMFDDRNESGDGYSKCIYRMACDVGMY